MRRVLSIPQVAQICNVAPPTVGKWFNAGRLKGYLRPGSPVRYIPRVQLIVFLKEHGMPLCGLEEQSPSVLLVGTVEPVTTELKTLLGSYVEVCHTASAFEAGWVAETTKPKCIVIDLDQGALSATSIVRRAKSSKTRPSLIAVARSRSIALNPSLFNDVFFAPFDCALLATRIRTLVERKEGPA